MTRIAFQTGSLNIFLVRDGPNWDFAERKLFCFNSCYERTHVGFKSSAQI